MQYKVIKEENLKILQKKVEESLRDGWKPQGGVAVVKHISDLFFYYQAMIKD